MRREFPESPQRFGQSGVAVLLDLEEFVTDHRAWPPDRGRNGSGLERLHRHSRVFPRRRLRAVAPLDAELDLLHAVTLN